MFDLRIKLNTKTYATHHQLCFEGTLCHLILVNLGYLTAYLSEIRKGLAKMILIYILYDSINMQKLRRNLQIQEFLPT